MPGYALRSVAPVPRSVPLRKVPSKGAAFERCHPFVGRFRFRISSFFRMSRRLRFIDNESGVVEVTARTLHGRFLLRPSPEVNDIILGALGRAQARYGVELYAFVFLSNHFHLLLRVDSARADGRFRRLRHEQDRQRARTDARLAREVLGTAISFRLARGIGTSAARALPLPPSQRMQGRPRRLASRLARCLHRPSAPRGKR